MAVSCPAVDAPFDVRAALGSSSRLAAKTGAWILLYGLALGIPAGLALAGQLPADGRSLLGAHLAALTGAFWLFGVSYTLPMLKYGPTGARRLVWATVLPNVANPTITAAKAFFFVHGLAMSGNRANDIVAVALIVTVVGPSLVAGTAWAVGFAKD